MNTFKPWMIGVKEKKREYYNKIGQEKREEIFYRKEFYHNKDF